MKKMNKRINNGLFLLMIAAIMNCGCRTFALSELGEAIYYGADTKVTFRVVDHKENPVQDAKVRITFYRRSKLKGRETIVLHEQTDENGVVEIQSKTTAKFILWVRKKGYYETWYDYQLNDHPKPLLKDGRWLPWNPTVDVLLKPKVKPVPMYAKRDDDMRIPLSGKPVGYDLEKGDWVEPYGKGVNTDLLFEYQGQSQDFWTFSVDLTISVSGAKAGIQILTKDMVSDFKSVYQAPLEGYEKRIRFAFNRTKTEMIEDKRLEKDEYLVFRTRTKVDDQGNLIEAFYGKIYPPLEFGSKGSLELKYYFNPHGTRNLEFDTDNNLFNFPTGSLNKVGPVP